MHGFAATTKRKETSRILKAVHATARDLYKTGFIDQRRMCEYNSLCLGPDAGRIGLRFDS